MAALLLEIEDRVHFNIFNQFVLQKPAELEKVNCRKCVIISIINHLIAGQVFSVLEMKSVFGCLGKQK